MSEQGLGKFCPHCGATDAHRLGHCKVCGLSVCEKCGNIQHSHGEQEVVHNECLSDSGDSFSMIKFISPNRRFLISRPYLPARDRIDVSSDSK